MEIINSLTNNIYFYWGIIILLLAIDIVLTVVSLRQRKRDKIKRDFLEIERQSEELEEKDEVVSEEIMAILNQMEEDSKLKPEEVVKRFEDDQEQNAIISYQELLATVNNNQVEIVEDDNGDIDFVKQLESETKVEPVNDAVTTNELLTNNKEETIEDIGEDDTPSHMDIIDELNKENKFVSSEIISPVFGRVDNPANYPSINFNNENTVEVNQVAGTNPEEEVQKNEAFLKALIEFRNNL